MIEAMATRAARPSKALWPILALYAALGLAYSTATPAGEGPDEPGHVAYVLFLKAHHRLPRHGDADGPLAQQVKHPPLYYAMGALATAWADDADLAFRNNPHFSVNLAHIVSPAAHQHTADERWPYAERYLSLRVLRWLTVLLGLAVVWATYQLAITVRPAEPALALGAAAWVAFLPQFLFVQGVANNDGLANPLAALALWLSARLAVRGADRRTCVALGAVLGLGLLTKLTVVAAAATAGLAVLVTAWRARSRRVLWESALCIGVPIAVVAGWWFARNAIVNGDVLGWGRWAQAADESLRRTPLAADLPRYFDLQLTSFWGRFGWVSVPLPPAVYRVLAGVSAAAAAGLVVAGGRGLICRRRAAAHRGAADDAATAPRPPRSATPLDDAHAPHAPDRPEARVRPPRGDDAVAGMLIVAAAAALVYASVFRLAFTFDLVVAQGRYLFTGLPAFGVLFVVGWAAWVPVRARPAAMAVLGAGMLGLAVWAWARVLVPAFAPPPALTAAEVDAIGTRVDVDFGPSIRLLGHDLAARRFRPGDVVHLPLYWTARGPVDEGYWQFAQVLDATGRVVGQVDRLPLGGRYPTLSWLRDQPFRDAFDVPIAPDAVPGQARLIVGLYPEGMPMARVPASAAGVPVGNAWRTDRLVIAPASPVVPDPTRVRRTAHTFGPPDAGWRITLVGYRVNRATTPGGAAAARPAAGAYTVTLYWSSTDTIDRDYTVFVHAVRPGAPPVVTGDGPPDRGRYPTSLWAAGEVVQDAHTLAIPADAPGGAYEVRVGLYDPATGVRLAGWSPDGAALIDGAAVIATVVHRPPP